MRQYLLFGSFSALYICSILAGTVYNLPGGQNLMILVVFMLFVSGLLKMTTVGTIAIANAPTPPATRTTALVLHVSAFAMLAWHGWFVLSFLVAIAAVCKLASDGRADDLRRLHLAGQKKKLDWTDLSDLNHLAQRYATDYASPHHFTLSVAQLRNLIEELDRSKA